MSIEGNMPSDVLSSLETSCLMSMNNFEDFTQLHAQILMAQFGITREIALPIAGFIASLRELQGDENKEARIRISTGFHQLLSSYSGLKYDYKLAGAAGAEFMTRRDYGEEWIDAGCKELSVIYSIPETRFKFAMRQRAQAYVYRMSVLQRDSNEFTEEDEVFIKNKLELYYELLLGTVEMVK